MDSFDLFMIFVAGFLACFHVEIIEACGERFTTSRSGVILSPNYPDKYGSDLYCTWEIKLPNGGKIVLNFHDFELESSYISPCRYDFLEITERKSNRNHTLLEKQCGTSMVNKTVVSSSDRIFVVFKSDGTRNYKGFKITWDACGGTFYDSTDHVTSPKSRFDHEPETCIFHLKLIANRSAIEVNMSNTRLGTYNGECLIQVFDSDVRPLGHLCNDAEPRIYIGNTNELTVEFKLIYQRNVVLNASFSKYECSEIVTDRSGLLKSPDYSTPFGRDSICDYSFNFTIDVKQLLEITFNDLDVNCNGPDVLQFYQYDSNDKVRVVEVCKDNKTDILYMENKLSMRFISVYDDTSARFSINYSIIDEPVKKIIDAVHTDKQGNSTSVIIGAVIGVFVGIGGIAALIAVTIYRRKREKPQPRSENIGTDVIYANTLEERIQYQREQQNPSSQSKSDRQNTSIQSNNQQRMNLRPLDTVSHETNSVEVDNLYVEKNDVDYDVLHKARERVPEKGDNLYDVSVKPDDQYDRTRQYKSTEFDSDDEMYDKANQFHFNDDLYDKAGMC